MEVCGEALASGVVFTGRVGGVPGGVEWGA